MLLHDMCRHVGEFEGCVENVGSCWCVQVGVCGGGGMYVRLASYQPGKAHEGHCSNF